MPCGFVWPPSERHTPNYQKVAHATDLTYKTVNIHPISHSTSSASKKLVLLFPHIHNG